MDRSVPAARRSPMFDVAPPVKRLQPEPLPQNLSSVQPGGGRCYSLELAWGRWRRWYLRRFRPGYVKRMAQLRQGDTAAAPHEVLDPRDLKFCRNQCTAHWLPADDPFAWRSRLGLARWGLTEVLLLGLPLAAATGLLGAIPAVRLLAVVPGVLLAFVVYFFRDPPRRVPAEADALVSPADGKVVEVVRLPHDEFIGGPAVRVAIFLSIFNVHVNRVPATARVIRLRYAPGEFRDARDPSCAVHNENLLIGLEEVDSGRRLVVRQVAGAIARRIVCELRPGEVVERGHKFGMIKFGSRTELIFPDAAELEVLVKVGQKLRGGADLVARYDAGASASPAAPSESR